MYKERQKSNFYSIWLYFCLFLMAFTIGMNTNAPDIMRERISMPSICGLAAMTKKQSAAQQRANKMHCV